MTTDPQSSLLDQAENHLTRGAASGAPAASSTVPAASNSLPATAPQPAAENQLITITETEQQKAYEIQKIVDECELSLTNTNSEFARGLVLAKGMRMLRAAFSKEIMADVMQLYNSPVGFLADRPNDKVDKPYSEDDVRDAVIQAQLKGARMVGKEFTIISRNAYLNKEYFERRVREIPGLSDLDVQPGAPVIKDGTAWVPIVATWIMTVPGPIPGTVQRQLYKLDRVAQKVDGEVRDNRIVVRINSGGGYDMAIGKATRKILAQIYKQMTGSKITGGNFDPSEIIDVDPGDAIVQEAPDDDFAGEAAAAHEAAGGAQTSKLAEALDEYGLELDQATDQVSIPLAAKAKSKLLNNHKELPAETRAKVEQMHDEAVKTIRAKKAAAPNRR